MDRLRRRALFAATVNVTAYLAVAFGRFRVTQPMREDPAWVGDLRIAWLIVGGPILAGLSLGWVRRHAGFWVVVPLRAPLVALLALPPLALPALAFADGDILGLVGIASGLAGMLYGLRHGRPDDG